MDFPERVFQEALLNALSHRDYQSNAAVYVKQYPDRIVIENPGGFLDGITEDNIITHPSIPRNKLIAGDTSKFEVCPEDRSGSRYYL